MKVNDTHWSDGKRYSRFSACAEEEAAGCGGEPPPLPGTLPSSLSSSPSRPPSPPSHPRFCRLRGISDETIYCFGAGATPLTSTRRLSLSCLRHRCECAACCCLRWAGDWGGHCPLPTYLCRYARAERSVNCSAFRVYTWSCSPSPSARSKARFFPRPKHGPARRLAGLV